MADLLGIEGVEGGLEPRERLAREARDDGHRAGVGVERAGVALGGKQGADREVARDRRDHARAVTPDVPALAGPGGGRLDADAEAEAGCGKLARGDELRAEVRDEDERGAVLLERAAHDPLRRVADQAVV